MGGVTIQDSTEDGRFLKIDLHDILNVLGWFAEESEWVISGVECVGGNAADELHRLSDNNNRVPGQTFSCLAADVTQIIDGVFKGYRKGENSPWVIIWAVNSSAYDVETENQEILDRIRKHFRNVSEIP
jgi:hypothetical protein